MNKQSIIEWLKLPDKTKSNIFNEISNKTGLPPGAIEKDWWVVRTLELVFATDTTLGMVFKGGTSLSKGWKLINRLSEDIDLAIDRKILNMGVIDSPSKLKRLRERSSNYICNEIFPKITLNFIDFGFNNIKLNLIEPSTKDEDPLKIEMVYPSITDATPYLRPKVLIEIGCRSLIEPHTQKSFCSLIGEYYKDRLFTDKNISVRTVNPEKTFLEKIFLLHEEFQKPKEKIRINRLSRHLYDIERIMDTEFGLIALQDKNLFNNIVEHRRTINPIRGIDYSNHCYNKIVIVPPKEIIAEWKRDYLQMQESMIYRDSLPFDKLISRIYDLQVRINQIV